MGIFAQIHYHYGECVELMERMEKVKRITGNPLHVLRMVNCGLIISNIRKFSLKLTKCCLVVHALTTWTIILSWTSVLSLYGLYPCLRSFSSFKGLWPWSGNRRLL